MKVTSKFQDRRYFSAFAALQNYCAALPNKQSRGVLPRILKEICGKKFQDGSNYFLRQRWRPCILLQRGITDFLSVVPPPFLGVSSLNLAAPPGAAIFL